MIEKNEFDVADLRREYTRGGLRRHDLTNPLELFERWLKQACDARLADPTAMCVATVDEHGQPYQRIVLLKHFDEQGWCSTPTSVAARRSSCAQPAYQPAVPLAHARSPGDFPRPGGRLSTLDVLKYFNSRPKDSQIGAWVSQQSSRISARGVLESKFLELKQKFQQGEVPLPSFWGGFRVKFDSVEFWQGGAHRLHDRFLYQRDGNDWKIDRLAP